MTGKERLRAVLWALGGILAFYMALTAWVKRNELVRQLAYLEHENGSVSDDNKMLGDFSRIISLDAVKEMEVKQRLNYAKQGETLVVFASPSPVPQATTTSSWLDKLLHVFGR